MALAVALLMGLVLIFLIVSAITLFFTYWYITFPTVALIIIYKKRHSIWKSSLYRTYPSHEAMPSGYGRRYYYSKGHRYEYQGNHTNFDQSQQSEWHKRAEWIRQQDVEDERRRKEFWENFWKQYESEFRQKSDQKALDDETVEDRRKRGDENFEEAWEEYKEKFEQDEDENYAKYYLLLGLKQSATYDELRQRFRELALKYHPDKNKTKKIQAAKKFTKILEAYEKIIERMKKCAV